MTRCLTNAAALVSVALAFGCVAAPARAGSPGWAVSSAPSPTDFAEGDETGADMYVLTVVDDGGESTAPGSPIEIADTLPSGLTASGISGRELGNGQALSCSLSPSLGCSYEGFEVAPGDVLQVEIRVKVGSGLGSSVVNSATVTGGGVAVAASVEEPTTISSEGAGFGLSGFVAWSGTQAGAAVNLTTGFNLNQVLSGGETVPAADAKDVALNLPPGFIANPTAVPTCSVSEAEQESCPESSAVGVAFSSSRSEVGGEPMPYSSLVYNLAPSTGELGALVLFLPSGPVRLGLALRTDGSYGLNVTTTDLTQVAALISLTLTLWSHPGVYGSGPDHVIADGAPSFGSPRGGPGRFLTSAGSCAGASPDTTLSADSWAAPDQFVELASATPALTGCDGLAFEPSLSVVPDTAEADTPSGYELDLDVPQSEDPEGLAAAELKQAAVTLPEGAGISLSSADGLQACTEMQVGLASSAPATCPQASKVGDVEVETPLLAHPLEGAIYLAVPRENRFAAPFAIYIVAEDPVSGLRVKAAGQLAPDPGTGRLKIMLGELPQLPISGWKLRFFGGAGALLSTPSVCGLVRSTGELTSWSGSTGATVFSAFEVDSGPNGASCQTQPFSPAFQSGTTTAGETDSYGSLTLLVSRTAQEEQLGTIAIQAPPAFQEMFAGVPACGEPQAADGTCPAASEIGNFAARAGPGPRQVGLNGAVYLTGPYGGASHGLSIVLPVDPGPFELGTVVVRASEQIDPQTGRMTILTDRLPSIVDGVPLQLTAILLHFDRGEFRVAPDGCESLTVTGTITGAQGSSVAIATEPLGVPSSSCPPQAALPPVAIPAGGKSATGGVLLDGIRVATTASGEAAVELACAGTERCSGKLTLMAKSRSKKGRKAKLQTIGRAVFSIAPGKTATSKLKLNAAGRALLKTDHGRFSASLAVLELAPGHRGTKSETVQIMKQMTPRRGGRQDRR
jgi:hypothetical protein